MGRKGKLANAGLSILNVTAPAGDTFLSPEDGLGQIQEGFPLPHSCWDVHKPLYQGEREAEVPLAGHLSPAGHDPTSLMVAVLLHGQVTGTPCSAWAVFPSSPPFPSSIPERCTGEKLFFRGEA